MKIMKKSFSVLLTVLLALSAFSAVASAADENVLLTGTAGTGITWLLTDDGVLTVSGSGPIQDEIAYDYDDNGEIISSQTLNSIAFSLTEYYDGQTAGMDVAAAERFRFNLVREIVIEEGITVYPGRGVRRILSAQSDDSRFSEGARSSGFQRLPGFGGRDPQRIAGVRAVYRRCLPCGRGTLRGS